MNEEKMSSKHYKDMILESIDQLRERKARPDLERIAHMMTRRYGIANGRTAALLEKLVDTDVVIKVEYKGQISYRNATKWKKRHLVGHILNSNHATKKVIEALEALSVDRPKTDEKGSSADEIAEWLLSQYTDTRLVDEKLMTVLQRETNLKRVVLLPNGRYKVNPRAPKTDKFSRPKSANKSASKLNVDNNSAASDTVSPPTTSPPKRGRPPSKRKKIQKDHGPDFETELVSKKFSAKSRCDFCLQGSDCNRKGRVEYLLACKDCNAKAHPSCMDYSEELARKARDYAWQCMDCKTCWVCEDSSPAVCSRTMLFCDACDKGYHIECHKPQLKEPPTDQWVCGECSVERLSDNHTQASRVGETMDPMLPDYGGTSCLPTPCDSPVSDLDSSIPPEQSRYSGFGVCMIQEPMEEEVEREKYPDASKWEINDVVEFFTSKGFPEQAQSFKEQEIDGQSLLLMKRCDVLTGLSLKLGPALKINYHIEKLQRADIDDL